MSKRQPDQHDQPRPIPGGAPVSNVAQTIARVWGANRLAEVLAARTRIGVERYGQELHTHDGRDSEHDALLRHGWTREGWAANGGYANASGSKARHTEQVWYSPGCLTAPAQGSLLALTGEGR